MASPPPTPLPRKYDKLVADDSIRVEIQQLKARGISLEIQVKDVIVRFNTLTPQEILDLETKFSGAMRQLRNDDQ